MTPTPRQVMSVAGVLAMLVGLGVLYRACAVADLVLPPPGQVQAYRTWFQKEVVVGGACILVGGLALWVSRRDRGNAKVTKGAG
jgi:hypothetical protein